MKEDDALTQAIPEADSCPDLLYQLRERVAIKMDSGTDEAAAINETINEWRGKK